MNMRSRRFFTIALICLIAGTFGCSVTADTAVTKAPEAISSDASPEIQRAESLIEKSPQSPAGYVSLASAFIKLGRETGDLAFNRKAQDAIDRGLEAVPSAPDLMKLNATLMLSGHRFGEANELGKQLEKDHPSDPFVLGILTDANVELGNYEAGAQYAQKLVDVRPNSSSYARAAHVRTLFGDHKGAVEMYVLAARSADPNDKEAQAWCLVQLGNEYWRAGEYKDSERVNDEALEIFPDYHHALFGKGRAMASRSEFGAAARYLANAQSKVSSMETAILLRAVYERLGDVDGASRQATIVESEEILGGHFDKHRLAHYWADNNTNPERSLEVAQADYATQKDIYASDTLAWCLLKTGRADEAKRLIEEAMRLGTRDAKLFYHAGMIEQALGDSGAAKRYLKTALDINPAFDLTQSEVAKHVLIKG